MCAMCVVILGEDLTCPHPGSSQRPPCPLSCHEGPFLPPSEVLRGFSLWLSQGRPQSYGELGDSKPVPGVGDAPEEVCPPHMLARAGVSRCQPGFQVLLCRLFQILWLGRPMAPLLILRLKLSLTPQPTGPPAPMLPQPLSLPSSCSLHEQWS